MAFTFRPSAQAEREIEKIKERFGIRTNSKALEHVFEHYMGIRDKLQETKDKLARTERELEAIKDIIARKAAVDRIYGDLVGTLTPK